MIILKTEERRENLFKRLKSSKSAIIGSELAEDFGVSRQVIVQDIALLRARGEKIIATSQGYLYPENDKDTIKATIACIHGEDDEVEEELMTIVNYGAKIIDVIVEHPIYGELKGMLMIKNPADVQEFVKNYKKNDASLLSSLTDGVHLHTVEALNEQVIKKIKEELKEKGYLLEK
ncbi:MAG TPA: transcription repressor NadR [Halanaerobiales bacterium]|nr:transcription repressor NadR [Halanaerobiales bacterium]